MREEGGERRDPGLVCVPPALLRVKYSCLRNPRVPLLPSRTPDFPLTNNAVFLPLTSEMRQIEWSYYPAPPCFSLRPFLLLRVSCLHLSVTLASSDQGIALFWPMILLPFLISDFHSLAGHQLTLGSMFVCFLFLFFLQPTRPVTDTASHLLVRTECFHP